MVVNPLLNRRQRWQNNLLRLGLAVIGLALLALAIYQIPAVNLRLSWRIEYAWIYMKSIVQPVDQMPTPVGVIDNSLNPLMTSTHQPTRTPTLLQLTATLQTPEPSPTPTLTPTPIPGKAVLVSPRNEKEDLNACGPATLAMYLRAYGWPGDQFTISKVIKPIRADRNVNVEELMDYVLHDVDGMTGLYRVGGNTDLLKKFVAAGIPVMVEESFKLDKDFRVKDDRWAGHYVLITGYDDPAGNFIIQDSERGRDRAVPYTQLDQDWQSFNRVYILVFKPEQSATIQSILGADWDRDANRQSALAQAKAETVKDPKNSFAWFNVGTNLTYFEEYTQAAVAYDTARRLGLPQRMLRYQFGPFMAYFHSGRTDDLMSLTEYALVVTENSEEAMLWQGWGLYRQGKNAEALDMFNKALVAHPGYGDALYAVQFVAQN